MYVGGVRGGGVGCVGWGRRVLLFREGVCVVGRVLLLEGVVGC